MARMKSTPHYSGPATDLQTRADTSGQHSAHTGSVLQGNGKQNVGFKRKSAPRDNAPSPTTAADPTTKTKVQDWLKRGPVPDFGDISSDDEGQDNDKENVSVDRSNRKISRNLSLAGCSKPCEQRSDTPESEASTIIPPGKGLTDNPGNPGDEPPDEEHAWLDLGGADINTSAEEASRSESEKTHFEMEVGDDAEVDVVQDESSVDADEDHYNAEAEDDEEQTEEFVKQQYQASQTPGISTRTHTLTPTTPSPPPRKRMRLADAMYDSPSKLNQPGRTVSPSTVFNYSPPLEDPDDKSHEESKVKASGEAKKFRAKLSNLPYDSDPSDRPYWIISGINKPLPHPLLTSSQYQTLLTKRYLEEVDRLVPIRKELMRNYSPNPGECGEWYYEGWGETREAEKTWEDGIVLARGVWKLVDIEGKVRNCVLDEWPRDVWGERLGWTVTVDGKAEIDEEGGDKGRNRDMGDDEEDEEEENDGEGWVSFMTLGRFGRLQKRRMAVDSVSWEDEDAEEIQEKSDVDEGEEADDEEEDDDIESDSETRAVAGTMFRKHIESMGHPLDSLTNKREESAREDTHLTGGADCGEDVEMD